MCLSLSVPPGIYGIFRPPNRNSYNGFSPPHSILQWGLEIPTYTSGSHLRKPTKDSIVKGFSQNQQKLATYGMKVMMMTTFEFTILRDITTTTSPSHTWKKLEIHHITCHIFWRAPLVRANRFSWSRRWFLITWSLA